MPSQAKKKRKTKRQDKWVKSPEETSCSVAARSLMFLLEGGVKGGTWYTMYNRVVKSGVVWCSKIPICYGWAAWCKADVEMRNKIVYQI